MGAPSGPRTWSRAGSTGGGADTRMTVADRSHNGSWWLGGRVACDPRWMRVWVALWTVYIVWGSTYLAIRYVVETMPALLSGGVRFFLAGLLFALWLVARRGA